MDSIWMGIAPGVRATRVIAMHGASETILKAHARAPRSRAHPRHTATFGGQASNRGRHGRHMSMACTRADR
jgi:hypothetical protein